MPASLIVYSSSPTTSGDTSSGTVPPLVLSTAWLLAVTIAPAAGFDGKKFGFAETGGEDTACPRPYTGRDTFE